MTIDELLRSKYADDVKAIRAFYAELRQPTDVDTDLTGLGTDDPQIVKEAS